MNPNFVKKLVNFGIRFAQSGETVSKTERHDAWGTWRGGGSVIRAGSYFQKLDSIIVVTSSESG